MLKPNLAYPTIETGCGAYTLHNERGGPVNSILYAALKPRSSSESSAGRRVAFPKTEGGPQANASLAFSGRRVRRLLAACGSNWLERGRGSGRVLRRGGVAA